MSKRDSSLSVIVPVLNGASHLDAALNCLAESLRSFDEIIIIDDGSVDATPEIIRSFTTKFQNSHLITNSLPTSPSSARNAGLAVAKGKYISFLDHDDLWSEGRVERHIEFLEEHDDYAAIVGKASYEFEGEMADKVFAFKDGVSVFHFVQLGAATFRAEIFEKVGFFNPSLRFGEDHDLYLRLRERGEKMYFEPDVSLRYRLHGQNMTTGKNIHELGIFRVLADSINRRKIQGNMELLSPFGNPTDKT